MDYPYEVDERYIELLYLLGGTDYIVTKIAEAQATDPESVPELVKQYEEELNNRKAWREEIREIIKKYTPSE